ncbi:LuxR C-terminal-related transcriptional regulator [uncultured Pseudomonas sp.]|uniref:LuxR C-terminal-related transcriptional regulator n=1 Tax=uncultured Pseudomonas sp. TaxID=114707 RepID=UPI0025E2C718|nr:LuxR C-terminal-related transcriptional regulator [uncultured Pseudomonas sp.]
MKTCSLPQDYPPAGFIPRHLYPRLLDSLVSQRLTLLCAPGGYGKSVAMAYCMQHVRQTSAHGLWVSPEHTDASSAHALLQALCAQLPGVHATPEALLQHFTELKGHWVVFLDGYEQLQNPANDALLERLLALPQPRLHIALASREHPAVKLSWLEGRGQVHWLGSAELAFSADESALLLGQLPARQRTHLHQLSEGWPLAVGLCRTLAQDVRRSAELAGFGARDRYLRDFFEEQVLSRLTPAQQQFLADFAVLGSAGVALCDEVLQRRDSQAQLQALYRMRAFTEPTDRNLDDYRLHPLLRAVLLERNAEPGHTRRLLIRATRAALRQQQYRRAADYARASAQPRIARLVISRTSEILVRNLGELPTLVEWTRDMPVSSLSGWNELVYWSTWSLAFSYCWPQAHERVRQLRAALLQDAELTPQVRRAHESKLDLLDTVLAVFEDTTDGVAQRSLDWLTRHADADAFDIAVIASARLLACKLEADCLGATAASLRAVSAIQRSGSVYGKIWVNLLNALYQLEFGDHQHARLLLEEQFFSAAGQIGEHSAILSTCALLLARIAHERDELGVASDYLDIGYRHIGSHGLIETAISGIAVRARLAARAGIGEALQVLDEAQSITAVYPPRLETLVQQTRIELLLDHGRTREALVAAQALELLQEQPEHHDTRRVPCVNQGYIELLLSCAREDLHKAGQQCLALLSTPAVQCQPPLHCRVLIVCSAQLERTQDCGQALQTLCRALSLASEHGLYRVFLDLRRFCEPLLRKLRSTAASVPLSPSAEALFERLCQALALPSQPKSPAALPEPLSRRELELLALLDSGMTYQQIADQVFISLATVKWHVYNIYGKLGVKNRSGALVAAHQLQLLSRPH